MQRYVYLSIFVHLIAFSMIWSLRHCRCLVKISCAIFVVFLQVPRSADYAERGIDTLWRGMMMGRCLRVVPFAWCCGVLSIKSLRGCTVRSRTEFYIHRLLLYNSQRNGNKASGRAVTHSRRAQQLQSVFLCPCARERRACCVCHAIVCAFAAIACVICVHSWREVDGAMTIHPPGATKRDAIDQMRLFTHENVCVPMYIFSSNAYCTKHKYACNFCAQHRLYGSCTFVYCVYKVYINHRRVPGETIRHIHQESI